MAQLVLVLTVLFFGLLPAAEISAQNVKFLLQTAVYRDGEDHPLLKPEGVAFTADAGIMVADSGNGRLLRYRFESETELKNTEIISIPQLNYPTKIQIDGTGDYLVLDRKPLRIVRLNAAGKFRSYVKPIVTPPPSPKSFALHRSGDLFILDALTARVLVLDGRGMLRSQINFPGKTEFLSDIAVDNQGRVLALDGVAGMVYAADRGSKVFAPLSTSLKTFTRFPAALTTDDRGRIYLSDRNGGRIIVLGQDGSFLGRLSGRGWKEGLLNFPSQVCIAKGGQLFVADTLNSRIQVFNLPD